MGTATRLRRHDRIRIDAFLERVGTYRTTVNNELSRARRAELGQFLTSLPVARLMASMLSRRWDRLDILDAGAGIGTLTAALVAAACGWPRRPKEIVVVAYEIDPLMVGYLAETLDGCAELCAKAGIKFSSAVRCDDFVEAAARSLRGGDLFQRHAKIGPNAAILNPPYRKIHTDSATRRLLSSVGIETSNLYTAFLWLTLRLLKARGELVAITPRSFCNGPYFRPFRQELLHSAAIRRIHVFESRKRVFAEDEVLQENIIVHTVKGAQRSNVMVTSSDGPQDAHAVAREVPSDQLVRPNDPNVFIHVAPGELDHLIAEQMHQLGATVAQLELTVSTGRVVDFRARHLLRAEPGADTAPLIYPGHLAHGRVSWPNMKSRKPNALAIGSESQALLVPSDVYVLVKRFSAKEERRRVVAAVYDPKDVPSSTVGFENHLNYYHRNGAGLPPKLAWGLAAFLNSTLVDSYFRQFSGHTQVNATDLRSLKYPTLETLVALGERTRQRLPPQHELDKLVADVVRTTGGTAGIEAAKKRIDRRQRQKARRPQGRQQPPISAPS